MHRPRHRHTIANIKLAAVFLCLSRIAIPVALGIAAAVMLTHDPRWIKWLIISTVVGACSAVLQVMFASGGKCPLCTVPVLARKSCSKNRNARKVLGSYRLPVVVGVLFRGHFRCPYCGEPTQLAIRPNGGQVRY